MALTDVDVANLALYSIGAQSITTFDDATEQARVMKAIYEPTRDVLLASHPWNFALRQWMAGNILNGGMFDAWIGGAAAAPYAWYLSGGSVAREATILKTGNYSAKLTRAGSDASLNQAIENLEGYTITIWKSRNIVFEAWVYASEPNTAKISIYDGVSTYSSAYHSGTPGWELLTVEHQINASATTVIMKFEVVTTDSSAYIDLAYCYERTADLYYGDLIKGRVLPYGCLRVLGTSLDDEDGKWMVHAGYLCTEEDMSTPVYIEFIANIFNGVDILPIRFSSGFLDAFVAKLAADASYKLVADAKLTANAIVIANEKLRVAKSQDAQENRKLENLQSDAWILSRENGLI